MSYGPDGGSRKPVLPDEDDWFATPSFQEPPETDEVAWQDDVPEPPPRHARDELAQRQLMVVLAVVAIVVVVAAGFLVARSLGGSDDTTATPTATVPTTPAETTPADTTPATTTPTSTAPASTTPTTTAPTTTVTSVPTDATLRPGDSGSSVTSLQQALSQLDYEPGTADGTYGPATTAAVAAFQQAEGLTEDGIAGPATLAAINTALAAG